MRQQDLDAANRSVELTACELVQRWLLEIPNGTARMLLRIVWDVVRRNPLCVTTVETVSVSPSEVVGYARRWLEPGSSESDAGALDRAKKVTIDVPSFVSELKRSKIPAPHLLADQHTSKQEARELTRYRLAEDRSWVEIDGEQHALNNTQRLIVSILYEDKAAGGTGLSHDDIERIANDRRPMAGTKKRSIPDIRQAFRNPKGRGYHAAWKTLVVLAGRGYYTLNKTNRTTRALHLHAR